MKVRCSPQRLKEEADRIDYKLLLDKERLRIRVQAGSKTGAWKGFSIIDEKRVNIILKYVICILFTIYYLFRATLA